MQPFIRQLRSMYGTKKKEIVSRLKEFSAGIDNKNDRDILIELLFCLLTPQSKAFCCWEAIRKIDQGNLLLTGSEDEIKKKLHRVRFHNKKAGYLVGARVPFIRNGTLSIKTLLRTFSHSQECREWLVKNIKGLGYKEASHFLRNIGMGDDLAILDRHVLRNLLHFGVIQKMPASLGRTRYVEIEQKMAAFAHSLGIPLAHLDLLLWYKETGAIFK